MALHLTPRFSSANCRQRRTHQKPAFRLGNRRMEGIPGRMEGIPGRTEDIPGLMGCPGAYPEQAERSEPPSADPARFTLHPGPSKRSEPLPLPPQGSPYIPARASEVSPFRSRRMVHPTARSLSSHCLLHLQLDSELQLVSTVSKSQNGTPPHAPPRIGKPPAAEDRPRTRLLAGELKYKKEDLRPDHPTHACGKRAYPARSKPHSTVRLWKTSPAREPSPAGAPSRCPTGSQAGKRGGQSAPSRVVPRSGPHVAAISQTPRGKLRTQPELRKPATPAPHISTSAYSLHPAYPEYSPRFGRGSFTV